MGHSVCGLSSIMGKNKSKLQHSQLIISHTILECMNIWKNAKECNAWACEIITTKPNLKFLAKTQKPQFSQKNSKTLGLNAWNSWGKKNRRD